MNPEQVDPTESGQEQEDPAERAAFLTPSSRGRQRKVNPKYLDFETDYAADGQKKTARRSSGEGKGETLKRTPAKRRKTEKDPQQTVDGDNEAAADTVPESDGITAKETPKKAAGAKKTPAKKTPGRKTPAKPLPTLDEWLVKLDSKVDVAAQQENGTPKPKRKYVKKQRVQETVTEAALCEEQAPVSEPEEEVPAGGRRRRGAAKAALKYLHTLAKEVLRLPGDEAASEEGSNSEADTVTDSRDKGKSPTGRKGQRGRKRKLPDSDSDAGEDEDFVPDSADLEAEDIEEEEDEGEEEVEEEDEDLWIKRKSPASAKSSRDSWTSKRVEPNGIFTHMMKPIWEAAKSTKKFRQEHHSSWLFPHWIPTANSWQPVAQSDLERYLPQELQSAAFKISREGLKQTETPLQRLRRFTALPAHPDRMDMFLFAGGPVWALEWCPTPDGAPASQYIALACHRGMDDRHQFNETYMGLGLIQLWDMGELECNNRPVSTPALAYGLALDKGFIWHLKWCPAGGWEPPSSDRKAPFLPRLGLLAVSTSNCMVTIYSLPHPKALLSSKKPSNCGQNSQPLPIYQVKGVLTLKLGSFRAPRHEKSGQVLSMDWLPVKPHNIMAIGFYDGVVGLWDLTTKSGLLLVRESDASLSLLPYRCFLAHDNAVRALSFCPASRQLLVTAGEDRYVKTWDLRRLHEPITIQKRYLTNEICWPLHAPGLFMAQDKAYVTYGYQGVHYFDHGMHSMFLVPRTSTVWSLSDSAWLNSVVTADSLGEVILLLLPQMDHSQGSGKQSLKRRFPVYLTSVVPFDSTKERNQGEGRVNEEDAPEEQEEGSTEELNGSEGRNKKSNETGQGGERTKKDKAPPLQSYSYKEAAKKCFVHHTDNNMLTFVRSTTRAVWKRMCNTENKSQLNLDGMTLAALHKVRFNPNMLSHTWLASGGQLGLVRLINLKGMLCSQTKNLLKESRTKSDQVSSTEEEKEGVQTDTEEL